MVLASNLHRNRVARRWPRLAASSVASWTVTSPAGRRIVHVVTSVRHGGAERVVLDLATQQVRSGARPSVLCLHNLGDLAAHFARAGIDVELLGGAERPGVLRTSRHLAGWLRRHRPDVVHTHNAAPQIAAGLAKRLWRAPIPRLVHTEHGRLSDSRPDLLRLRTWSARAFDVVVAVSADVRERLLAAGVAGRNGVCVIRNGVDLSRFSPPTESRPSSGNRIVHVGRLNTIKGQDLLIEAMVAVNAAIPDAMLTIVGDGPTRAALESQATRLGLGRVVRFAGSQDDVRPFLAGADLFVLPSRSEGISIALLEAMASGLAAVVTDVGGNREVVIAGETGTVVLPEAPDALAEGITATLSDPARRSTMGANSRRRVEVAFSLTGVMEAYNRAYRPT